VQVGAAPWQMKITQSICRHQAVPDLLYLFNHNIVNSHTISILLKLPVVATDINSVALKICDNVIISCDTCAHTAHINLNIM